MNAIQGVNGLPESAVASTSAPATTIRVQSPAFVAKSDAVDAVEISATAEQASVAVGQSSELRRQRIEEVKARLEEGTYKLQAAVLMVAARVAPYVE